MSRRLWIGLGLSFFLHLFLVLLLPGPDRQSVSPSPVQTLDVRLSLAPEGPTGSGAQNPRDQQGGREDSVNNNRPRPRDNPGGSEPREEKQEKQTTNELPKNPRPDPDSPRSVEPTPSNDDSDRSDQAPEAPREQQTNREPTNRPTRKPSYLKRGGRFRTAGQGHGSSPPPRSASNKDPRQTAVTERFQKFEIKDVKQSHTGDTAKQTLLVTDPAGGTISVAIPTLHIGSGTTRSGVPVDLSAADEQSGAGEVSVADRRLLKQPIPEAPTWLEKTGEEVSVVVEYFVGTQGNVVSMNVLKSSGYPELDEEVLRHLQNWKYEPGTERERRVITFRYELETGT